MEDDVLEELNPLTPLPKHNEVAQLEQSPVSASDEAQQTHSSQEPRSNSKVEDQSSSESILPSSNVGYSENKAHLVTPAVRHLLKRHNLDIQKVQGTGKDGRILKDDVQQHILALSSTSPLSNKTSSQVVAADQRLSLSPIETQMFKVMTRSLNIPHFLYAHTVDFTSLGLLRKRLINIVDSPLSVFSESHEPHPKLALLPFIMKALSLAFLQFPKLNSHLDTQTEPNKLHLVLKASHNFGFAVDTPQGLLVPVVRDVQNQSVFSLAREIRRISRKGRKVGTN